MNLIHITMLSGEKITGKLVQEDKLYVYVQVELTYDEEAIAIFGKDYCDTHKTQIIKLPKDEILLSSM